MVQLNSAFYTAFALDQIPRVQRPQAVAAASRALEQAQALAPNFGDVFIPGCLLRPQTRIAQCEKELRAGTRADADAPFVNSFLGRLLRDVGRVAEGDELTKLAYVHDPYMPAKISNNIQTLAASGDDVEASKLYRRATVWWPQSDLIRGLLSGLIQRGDFEAITKVKDAVGKEVFPNEFVGTVDVARATISNSLDALKHSCANSDAPGVQRAECMLALAKLGDMDSAYALAAQLYPARLAQTQAEQERIWLDQPDTMPLVFITSAAASALRRDQRYLRLAQRVGLIEYWRSGQLPDFCRNRPEAICAQLKRN